MSDEPYQPDTQQHTQLRDRIAAALAAHEPVTEYDGAHGECIECDLIPRWPDEEASTGPSAGWKEHAAHLADAVTDLLIDMAGKGELLKAIDGMYR